MYTDAPIRTYSDIKGYNISFERVYGKGDIISFPAFLKDFTDNYRSNWTADNIYGRHEPIYSFGQTTRQINFSIDIPSASLEEGQQNFIKVKNLATFLYPTYTKVNGIANVIDKTPLFRIRFSNLIGRGFDRKNGAILGRVTSVAVSPVIENGFYDAGKTLYPKLLTLTIALDVMHEESPRTFPGSVQEKAASTKPKPATSDNRFFSDNAKQLKQKEYEKTEQQIPEQPIDGLQKARDILGGSAQQLNDPSTFQRILDSASMLGNTSNKPKK